MQTRVSLRVAHAGGVAYVYNTHSRFVPSVLSPLLRAPNVCFMTETPPLSSSCYLCVKRKHMQDKDPDGIWGSESRKQKQNKK